jgi:hypothetical protein
MSMPGACGAEKHLPEKQIKMGKPDIPRRISPCVPDDGPVF